MEEADLKGITIGKDFKLEIDQEAVKKAGKKLADAMATPIPTE